MASKITARIPTMEYGYLEIEADSFGEYVELEASVQDHLAQQGFTPGATEQAQQNLEQGGVAQQGLQGAGRPQWQQNRSQSGSGNNAKYAKLGTDPLTGEEVTIEFEGQYGPYVHSGQKPNKVYANVPKGKDPHTVTIQDAAGYLAARRNG